MNDKFEISYRITSAYGTPSATAQSVSPTVEIPAIPTPEAASQNAHFVHILARLTVVAFWFIMILSAFGQSMIGLNNDHSTLTYQTQRMLAGAVPYVDYTDVSPPMIHLLYSVPVLLAGATGMPIYMALKLVVLFSVILSLIVCGRILKRSELTPTARALTLSSIGLALLTASFIHQLYADREHLVMVFGVPFMLIFSPIVDRKKVPVYWRILVGVLAAIGFSIKPYFYVFYATVIGYVFMRERNLSTLWRDIENLIIISWGLVYASIVIIYFPTYITDMLPLGWATYGSISWSFSSKLDVVKNELFGNYGALATLCVLWILFSRNAVLERWMIYMLFLAGAALASYFLNGGWRYTQYPFIVTALVFTVLLTADIIDALSKQSRARGKIIVISLLCALQISYSYLKAAWERGTLDMDLQQHYGHPLESQVMPWQTLDKLTVHLKDHPRFLLLSTNFWGVNIASTAPGREHVGRFDYLWMLPGLLEMQSRPGAIASFEKNFNYTASSIAADLENQKPDIVLVDVSPYQRQLPLNFKVLDFLRANADFKNAMSGYELADSFNVCETTDHKMQDNCAYEVYYPIKGN